MIPFCNSFVTTLCNFVFHFVKSTSISKLYKVRSHKTWSIPSENIKASIIWSLFIICIKQTQSSSKNVVCNAYRSTIFFKVKESAQSRKERETKCALGLASCCFYHNPKCCSTRTRKITGLLLDFLGQTVPYCIHSTSWVSTEDWD